MDASLQNKISDVLKSVPGLGNTNVFYLNSDTQLDTLPRVVFFSVSDVKENDTEAQYSTLRIQISIFNHFSGADVAVTKALAKDIEAIMNIGDLSGMSENFISTCKLKSVRESQLDKVYQYDMDFRLMLTTK